MRIHKIKVKFSAAAMFLAVLVSAGAVVGCSDSEVADVAGPKDEIAVGVAQTRPSWDVEDMVKRSDAVVVGSFSADLGSKERAWPGGQLNISFKFKDYQFEVEEVLYPKGNFPSEIAVLVEAGISASDAAVIQPEEVPAFQEQERMLLFLESLEGPEFSEGAGRPVPKGFSEQTYYRVIIGNLYGKLLPEEDEWDDSRTGKTLTVDQIADAVQRHKLVSE